jgi:hypothetical protein
MYGTAARFAITCNKKAVCGLALAEKPPSPLVGEGRGGGEKYKCIQEFYPPTLTLPHKGRGKSPTALSRKRLRINRISQ